MPVHGRLRRYFYDEVCWIALIVGMLLSMVAVTWIELDQRLAIVGLFMGSLCIAGWALHPRLAVTVYDRVFSGRNFAVWLVFVLLGIVATGVVQWVFVTAGQASALATIPLWARTAFLALTAIGETFFLFWFLECSVATYIHPLAGILLVVVAAGILHLFVYGGQPSALLAVSASFAVQAVLFEVTGRLSVPLMIHLGVNLLPILLSGVVLP
jgi:hypothetical protein